MRLQEEIASLNEKVILFGMTNDEYKKEKELKGCLSEVLAREEIYWRNKSRKMYISPRDLNTKFFHSSVKPMRLINKIEAIKDDNGQCCLAGDDIEKVAVQHFENPLGSFIGGDVRYRDNVLKVIEQVISQEENEAFHMPFSLEEVKEAAFILHPNKVPGLNAFIDKVYQKCWDFMGEDIWMMVEEFRKKRRLVKEINIAIIFLIPKKYNCEMIVDYRPISLCNSIYKVISKTMALRLKNILH